jgi:hypothetical protein
MLYPARPVDMIEDESGCRFETAAGVATTNSSEAFEFGRSALVPFTDKTEQLHWPGPRAIKVERINVLRSRRTVSADGHRPCLTAPSLLVIEGALW